jgi:hypothetical protein
LIREVGTRAWLRVYWDTYGKGYNALNTCPNSWGKGTPGCHDTRILLGKSPTLADWEMGGDYRTYPEDRWPTKCENCGAPVPPEQRRRDNGEGLEVVRQILRKRLYNTDSGEPEKGDLFWTDWHHTLDGVCIFWDNCKGPHLMAILPNGRIWDIDSRASNCTIKEERLHRCWIRRGDPPLITAGKDGPTCSAGAGSIAAGDYHGFLVNGEFSAG